MIWQNARSDVLKSRCFEFHTFCNVTYFYDILSLPEAGFLGLLNSSGLLEIMFEMPGKDRC